MLIQILLFQFANRLNTTGMVQPHYHHLSPIPTSGIKNQPTRFITTKTVASNAALQPHVEVPSAAAPPACRGFYGSRWGLGHLSEGDAEPTCWPAAAGEAAAAANAARVAASVLPNRIVSGEARARVAEDE